MQGFISVHRKIIEHLGDLRDSGSIEQDADIVLMIYRKNTEDDTSRILKIARGRNVRTGKINMKFEGKFTRFFFG